MFMTEDGTDLVETSFGTGIKLRREKLGMTQGDLAQAIGTWQTTVAKWEQRSNSITSAERLKVLAKALHTSVRELRAGLVPRLLVNPSTEESMMLGPIKDLQRIRKLDGELYDTVVLTLSIYRREAERRQVLAQRRYERNQQGIVDDQWDDTVDPEDRWQATPTDYPGQVIPTTKE